METATEPQSKAMAAGAGSSASVHCADDKEENHSSAISTGMAVSIGAGTVGIVVAGPVGGLVGAAVGAAVSTVVHAVKGSSSRE